MLNRGYIFGHDFHMFMNGFVGLGVGVGVVGDSLNTNVIKLEEIVDIDLFHIVDVI